MLNIVRFGAAVLEKAYMILGTLFEQTRISLPQGCSMLNINAFCPVVH